MTDGVGELAIEGEHAVLTFVRRLNYPIEAVWEAITDPEQRAAWFGKTSIHGRVGGLIDMMPSGPAIRPEQKRMTGRILVWDPPHVLEHEWRQPIVDDGVVRYELARDGEVTVLTFTHRGLHVPDARGFAPGTHAFLDRLAAHLAGSRPPRWLERYTQVAACYADPA